MAIPSSGVGEVVTISLEAQTFGTGRQHLSGQVPRNWTIGNQPVYEGGVLRNEGQLNLTTLSGYSNGYVNRQAVTLNFPINVKNLRFSITNIDKNVGHDDIVAVTPGFSVVESHESRVGALTGDGTQGNPWRQAISNNGPWPGADEQVTVRYADELQSVTIDHWNGGTGNVTNIGTVALGPISFEVCP